MSQNRDRYPIHFSNCTISNSFNQQPPPEPPRWHALLAELWGLVRKAFGKP